MASGGWQGNLSDIAEETEPSEASDYHSSRSRSDDRRSPLVMSAPAPARRSTSSSSSVPTEPGISPMEYRFSSSSSTDPDCDPPVIPPALLKGRIKGKGPIIRHTARKKVRFPPPGFPEMQIDRPVPPPQLGRTSPSRPAPPEPQLLRSHTRSSSFHMGESSDPTRGVEHHVPRRASIDHVPGEWTFVTSEEQLARIRGLEVGMSQTMHAEFARMRAEMRAGFEEIKSKKGLFSSVWSWIRKKK